MQQQRIFQLVCLFTLILYAFSLDYIVNYERLEMVHYEKSLVKNGVFLFRKYNRTNFCLNTSFTLLEDLDGNEMEFTTSVWQLFSNRYKPTGIELKYNVCKYWKMNLNNIRQDLGRYGNLEACDVKKGFYYLYNYMPDENQFPKFLPLGRYMAQMDVVWRKTTKLLTFQWYGTALLKIGNRVFN